jgi:hypothetical protein
MPIEMPLVNDGLSESDVVEGRREVGEIGGKLFIFRCWHNVTSAGSVQKNTIKLEMIGASERGA